MCHSKQCPKEYSFVFFLYCFTIFLPLLPTAAMTKVSKAQQSFDKFLINLGPGGMRSPSLCCFSHSLSHQNEKFNVRCSGVPWTVKPQSFVPGIKFKFWAFYGVGIGCKLSWSHPSSQIMSHHKTAICSALPRKCTFSQLADWVSKEKLH